MLHDIGHEIVVGAAPAVHHADQAFFQQGMQHGLQRQEVQPVDVEVAADVAGIDTAVVDQLDGEDRHEEQGFQRGSFQEAAELVHLFAQLRFHRADELVVRFPSGALVGIPGSRELGIVKPDHPVGGALHKFGDLGQGLEGVEILVISHDTICLNLTPQRSEINGQGVDFC